jgi:hypothetical protein
VFRSNQNVTSDTARKRGISPYESSSSPPLRFQLALSAYLIRDSAFGHRCSAFSADSCVKSTLTSFTTPWNSSAATNRVISSTCSLADIFKLHDLTELREVLTCLGILKEGGQRHQSVPFQLLFQAIGR